MVFTDFWIFPQAISGNFSRSLHGDSPVRSRPSGESDKSKKETPDRDELKAIGTLPAVPTPFRYHSVLPTFPFSLLPSN